MPPVVMSVSPDGGPQAGNTRVTLTGSGFTGATNVLFGQVPAILFVIDSDTQIRAVSPPEPPGDVSVQVTGPNGTSPAGGGPGGNDGFRYITSTGEWDPLVPLLPIGTVPTLVENLRSLIGEKIPAGGSADNTSFTDDELADLINRHNGNLYLAAGEAWQTKAASAADLVDVAESGSERKLSQLFKNYSAAAAVYNKAGLDFQQGVISRPTPKTARILDPALGTTFDAAGQIADLYAYLDPWQSGTARYWPVLAVLV